MEKEEMERRAAGIVEKPPCRSYVALDLETTGLRAKQDRIIEIGAVLVENGSIAEEFSTLINPRMQLSEQVTEITGICQQEVDQAPEIEEVLPRLEGLLGEHVLLGHRILFDYSFLKRVFVNQGKGFERKGIDTLKLARRYLPQLPSKRLEALCRYYQIPQHAHRALEDARAAHALYERLCLEFYEPGAFAPIPLLYKIKKEAQASKKQRERLSFLLLQHKLSIPMELESMSKNEVSRLTDQILAKYGRSAPL